MAAPAKTSKAPKTSNGEVAVVDLPEDSDQTDAPEYDPDWEHERIDYMGDNLAVRKPKMQALSAFQLSSSKYVSEEKQGNIVGMFIDRHLGADSYDRVMERMMDPDDPGYTSQSVSELMGLLVKMAVEDIKAEAARQLEEADTST